MKVKSTVLLGLILFICLLCGVSLMAHLNSKQDEWRPSDIYSTLGGSRGNYFTTVSYGAGASSTTSMPVLSHSGSLFNHGAAFSYAHAGVPVSQSPIANTAAPQGGLYLTSSAEVRTFGGGSNAVVSVNGGSAQMAPVSPIASVNGMNMSSSLSTASQLAAGAGLQMPTNMLSGLPSGDIAMAAYAGIGSGSAGRMGLGGRQEAPGSNANAWLNWLYQNGLGYGTNNGDGTYGFTYSDLRAAYDAYIASGAWKGMWNEPPTFEDWLSWFADGSFSIGGKTLYWIATPIGDAWVLLLFAIAYVAWVIVHRRKLAK